MNEEEKPAAPGFWKNLEARALASGDQQFRQVLGPLVRAAALVHDELRTRAGDLENTVQILDDNLARVDEAVKEAQARWHVERRLAALQSAREHVNQLPSEQPNARGYRDHALRPEERTAMELKVARYLLGDEG